MARRWGWWVGLGAVLALVPGVIVLGIRGRPDPAEAAVHADFRRVLGALEQYRRDAGRFPDEGDSLSFLVPAYLPSIPEDPWGRRYLFSSNGDRPFLMTWGQDGERGGTGPNQDHTQHDGHL